MSPFKLDKTNFFVAQSTFKRRTGNKRGLRKRLFLLTTGSNGSDGRQLMGFISWPFIYKCGKAVESRKFQFVVNNNYIRTGNMVHWSTVT